MKCWEIKHCIFEGTNPEESKCPPHMNQCGCWEYDWITFYKQMPECKEKIEWKEIMLENCPNCVVYKHKNKAIDKVLRQLIKV